MTEINRIGTDPTLSLEELAERMKPMFQRAAIAQAESLERMREDLKFWGWTAPTRWQRFKNRLVAGRERLGEVIAGRRFDPRA